jgi:hypothetical protein
VDTVYVINGTILRNPDRLELDSTLRNANKSEPDSVFAFSITNDSAYVFPISNYQSGLLETKIAGDLGQVSEVRQEGNLKFLYKLKVDENALKRRNINPKPTEYRKKTIADMQSQSGEAKKYGPSLPVDTTVKKEDIFESEFEPEAGDTTSLRVVPEEEPTVQGVLQKSKHYLYKLKFSVDNFSSAFNNDILINRYEPFTGSLPVVLQSGGAFNGMLKASVFDLFEDIRFTGALRLPLIGGLGTGANIGGGGIGSSVFIPVNQSLFDGGGEWFARADYLKKRLDYSIVYYRKTEIGGVQGIDGSDVVYEGKQYSNLYQGVVKYPFDRVKSLRFSAGVRTDKVVVRGTQLDPITLKAKDLNKQTFFIGRVEYVHDNTIQKATNIMHGLRFKIYTDINSQLNKKKDTLPTTKVGKLNFNLGTDIRYYLPIYRNFIWAGRAAADFSWGNQKIVYYLGGVDGWMFPKYNSEVQPKDQDYAYQSLAVNLRGFKQNVSNGNNAVILNSEFRLPVFSTLFNKPINNAFLRNFQVIQFVDLGSAWNGAYDKIERPQMIYPGQTPDVTVLLKAGGIGPFVGGYGFGVRSTLLGYFLRLDAGWEMRGFFRGKPLMHFAMGVDF